MIHSMIRMPNSISNKKLWLNWSSLKQLYSYHRIAKVAIQRNTGYLLCLVWLSIWSNVMTVWEKIPACDKVGLAGRDCNNVIQCYWGFCTWISAHKSRLFIATHWLDTSCSDSKLIYMFYSIQFNMINIILSVITLLHNFVLTYLSVIFIQALLSTWI